MPSHIALIGLPGVGKSTVAVAVAERLGLDAVDLDERIAQRAGRSIADVFAADGEGAFRELEAATLAEVLEPDAPAVVVACGGGIVIRPENRDRLAARARCVWLDAPDAVLAARLGDGETGRPLLDGGGRLAKLTALRLERTAWYRQVAGEPIEIDDLGPDEVADAVVELVA